MRQDGEDPKFIAPQAQCRSGWLTAGGVRRNGRGCCAMERLSTGKTRLGIRCPDRKCAPVPRGQRRKKVGKAVTKHGVSVALVCRAFGGSATCDRTSPLPSDETDGLFWGLPGSGSRDFMADGSGGGRAFRLLTVLDDFNRKGRVGNGPDCISGTLLEWAKRRTIQQIQPGQPQQNADIPCPAGDACIVERAELQSDGRARVARPIGHRRGHPRQLSMPTAVTLRLSLQ